MPEDDKPPEHPTARLVPPTEAEIDHARIGKLEERMAVLETTTASNHDEVMTAMDKMGERLFQGMQSHAVLADKRFQLLEARSNTHSDRVRSVSESDLTQEAKIAAGVIAQRTFEQALTETNKRLDESKRIAEAANAKADAAKQTADAVNKKQDTQLEILGRLEDGAKAFFKHPVIQLIIVALSIFLTGYIAAHGGKP